jgi:DtxR family Mn-dependent transcriptional regulator
VTTTNPTEHADDASSATAEVFVACRSNSARSQVAADLAAELAARRAGSVRPLDVVAADGGPSVVAIDGCSSACGARLLDAHGLTPVAALTLDDVDVDRRPFADTVGVAAALVEQGGSARRARRPAPPAATASAGAHSVEDYLIAIDWLTSPVGPCGALVENAPTLAAHVSSTLGVSRPTAGEMLGRLEQQGLIRRGASKELVLTATGRDKADRVVRAHRVLERFAVDTLGYGLDTCFAHARRLAPSFDDEAIARLERALGHPGRCPHGWPVDPAAARDDAAHLVALTALAAGASARVELLPESDPAALAQALDAGLVPGAEVWRGDPRVPGVVHVTADGRDRVLAAGAAAAVLVRPA